MGAGAARGAEGFVSVFVARGVGTAGAGRGAAFACESVKGAERGCAHDRERRRLRGEFGFEGRGGPGCGAGGRERE
jgi:hypothetical protein